MKAPIKKTCERGHVFYKRSDCPVCPICEKEKPETNEEIPKTSAPAKRALDARGIRTLSQLAKLTESELLELHGMGPKAVSILKIALKKKGFAFKKQP